LPIDTQPFTIVLIHIYCKKVKYFHTCYRALGPELVPVYRLSACRWLFKSSPGGRLPLLSARSAVTSQPKNVTVLWPVPSYTASWQRHIGVNNLPKVVTQVCPCGNWTHDLLITSPTPYPYATVPTHIDCTVLYRRWVNNWQFQATTWFT